MINNKINRWWTVAGGALACAVSIGVIGNSFGIFTKAIAAEFGWARSTATLGLTIQHIFSGLSFAPLGAVLLRWDVRRPTAILVVICAICIFSLGLVPNSPWIYYLLFGVMGAASAAATAMPYSVAIVRWFDEYRGVALGLMVMGTGIGASFVPLYTNYLLSNYGWRIGFMALAATLLCGNLFALAFMVRTPETKSREAADLAPSSETLAVPSYFEIFTRLPRFWLIGAPIFLLSVVVAGILINIVPIMTDAGYTTGQAVGMLSVAGIASISSRVLVGFCLDRVLAPYVGAAVLLIATLGLLIILFGPIWLPAAYVAALCIGFSLGAEADMITFMVSRYFRPEVYSKVVGTIFLLFAWGNATGISVASYAHDYVGSYRSAIASFVALNLLSVMIILRLGEYPYPARRKSQPVSETETVGLARAPATAP
ncbi:MFS transporter [Bradyrhizobium liaoningense]|uniref:MFS transporter n=1 Tax=Bradyrhizobium liaoningense TaxID=43992 RepID=UPI001BA450F6|nr:MFS transporter [Bradyrhizobium liaoningense]MBR0718502.1 MFS transporter [Bradyrhizobium liaoningense]